MNETSLGRFSQSLVEGIKKHPLYEYVRDDDEVGKKPIQFAALLKAKCTNDADGDVDFYVDVDGFPMLWHYPWYIQPTTLLLPF